MVPGQGANQRLRVQRRVRGWSQDDVATGLHRMAAALGEPELGVDAAMVGRWERGARRPRPRYVRLLSALFDLPAAQLGLVEDPGLEVIRLPEPRQDKRPGGAHAELVRAVAALLGVADLPPAFTTLGPEPWERLAQALDRPARVGAEAVDHLEHVTVALQSLAPTEVGPRALLGPVTGHMDALTLLLHGSLPAWARRRLTSIAGDTAGLAGWLRWNLGDFDGAADYFHTGQLAAREAGDAALGVYLAGCAACLPAFRGDPTERLRRLQGGSAAGARADATPASQVWLAAKEADVHALLGAERESLRALDQAEAVLNRAGGPDREPRPRFTTVGPDWLTGERGASLARLGRNQEARALLTAALASLGPTRENDRLWLMAALAGTYARDGEPEEASRLGRAVLARAAALRLEPVVELVRELRRNLDQHAGSPALQAFDDELLAVDGGDWPPTTAQAEPA